MAKKDLCLFDIEDTLTGRFSLETFCFDEIAIPLAFLTDNGNPQSPVISPTHDGCSQPSSTGSSFNHSEITKPLDPKMLIFLFELQKIVDIGLVGGSYLEKIQEQIGKDVEKTYNYVFPQNGLVAYKDGILIQKENILQHMGEEKLQSFINFCLEYMSKLNLPAKRGNFVKITSDLINICPVGKSCTQKEAEEFAAYDKEHKIREQFIDAIRKKFPDLGLDYSIGGQTSFDCFPTGLDKTLCLKYINQDAYNNIHFFGKETFPGKNDIELLSHKAVLVHTVTSPEDTMEQLNKMYKMEFSLDVPEEEPFIFTLGPAPYPEIYKLF